MAAHYYSRPYSQLPNYFGYQYIIPQYSAWSNYTIPYAVFPGDFYVPHYYGVRNDSEQLPTVVCNQTKDGRYCPVAATEIQVPNSAVSACQFADRVVSSTPTLAQCNAPQSWPMSFEQQ